MVTTTSGYTLEPADVMALGAHLKTLNPPIEVTGAILRSDGSGLITARHASTGPACYFANAGHPHHDYNLDGTPVRGNAPKRLSGSVAAAFALLLTDSEVAA